MVGVPDFAWCRSGPSARMRSRIWSFCMRRMIGGPITRQNTSAVMPA